MNVKNLSSILIILTSFQNLVTSDRDNNIKKSKKRKGNHTSTDLYLTAQQGYSIADKPL
jgi:hypothetical protein